MAKQDPDSTREAIELSGICNASAEKGYKAVTETNRAMQEINDYGKKIAEILKAAEGMVSV